MDTVIAAERPANAQPIRAEFVRPRRSLFLLALGQVCLTILTLGIYRFWMTTRLRRYYWSSIRIMGDPFEYTGSGLEKLVGFLLAVIILGVYLTIVNFAFVFAGLYSTDDVIALQVAINLSVVASLPLIHFATYRARRYVMARTRWRGIRFGMEQAAWGYAWRAVGLNILTALTLGLLYPFQHFRLTRYVTDRTWFGDRKFNQAGRWTALMRYWTWIYLGVAITGGGAVAIALYPEDEQIVGVATLVLVVGYFIIYLLMLRYRVAAFRYLWNHRTLGTTRFNNDVDTGEVIGIHVAGSTTVWTLALVAALVAMVVAAVGAVLILGVDRVEAMVEAANDGNLTGRDGWAILTLLGVGYLSAIPVGVAFNHIFMTRPILARQVKGLRIADAEALGTVRQRSHDHATEAGGFADALGVDIGSGF